MDGIWTEWATLMAAFAACGAASGLAAGAIGVGGGLALAPSLVLALKELGYPPEGLIETATTTALAALAALSARAAAAHHRRGAVDWALVGAWAPGLALGAAGGAWIGGLLPLDTHPLVFGLLLAAVAVAFALNGAEAGRARLAQSPPRSVIGTLWGGAVGIVAALIGSGGGALAAPALAAHGAPFDRAAAGAAAMGVIACGVGAAAGLALGLAAPPAIPGAFGWLNLPGFAVIAVAMTLAAPTGARMGRAAPGRTLGFLYGLLVAVLALDLVREALSA